jgi:hypothetical protein
VHGGDREAESQLSRDLRLVLPWER